MREMKDSGIPWIGEIPKTWEVAPLWRTLRRRTEVGRPNEIVLSLYRDLGIVPKDSRDDNHNVTSLDTSSYKFVRIGDFVINKMKAWQGSMAVSSYQGIVSPAYHVCEFINGQVNPRYLHYLLRNSAYLPEYGRLSSGLRIGQWDLSFDNFKSIPHIVPSLEEQQRIVDFLDAKFVEINRIQENTRASIEDYKALKQAVVTEAITKGIRGERLMKDSGVEWIGMIPAEWDIFPLKKVLKTKLQYGANESGIPFSGTLPRYVRITDICNNSLRDDLEKQSLTQEQSKGYLLEDGDILFARSGATVGKSFLFKKEYGLCAFAGYLIRAQLSDILLNWYLYYYTLSSCYEEWKKQIFIQSTIQNIGADRFNQLTITIPPLEEQKEIVTYLDKKCGAIDSLIASKEALIGELDSYKKSLIFEYVTGKKEVPVQEGGAV